MKIHSEAHILCLETATETCSVCIGRGAVVMAEEDAGEKYVHASRVSPLIRKCLSRAGLEFRDLDAVSVSIGPGSYTGLRIGLASGKGIAFARDIPLITVESLEALAHGALRFLQNKDFKTRAILPTIDARRMDAYCQLFDSKMKALDKLMCKEFSPEYFNVLINKYGKLCLIGNAVPKLRALFLNSPDSSETSSSILFLNRPCRSSHLLNPALAKYRQKDFADLHSSRPLYLKPPRITRPK